MAGGALRLRKQIESDARELGFCAVAFTRPDAIPAAASRLKHFVNSGHHGTMEWMSETLHRRCDPKTLWPEVRSIVMLAMNYGPEDDPLGILEKPECGAISVYARNRDYHDVIKGRLKQVAQKLASTSGADVKVFVDTAPVMEKPLAQSAGLGWQGKHTNLVSRDHGSWLFLGSIFTTADLGDGERETDHCGNCRACLDICPTDAFPAPHQLDARRCISYLTIEHKGPIPHEFRKAMGNRIYGCDDCLAVCPWNKFASSASEAKLKARDDLREPRLSDLLGLDDAAFRVHFSGSPIKRIGRNRFMRNVLIAAGNSGDLSLVPSVRNHLLDPDPVVRGAAVWALGRLPVTDLEEFAGICRSTETDSDVLEEWQSVLKERQ